MRRSRFAKKEITANRDGEERNPPDEELPPGIRTFRGVDGVHLVVHEHGYQGAKNEAEDNREGAFVVFGNQGLHGFLRP